MIGVINNKLTENIEIEKWKTKGMLYEVFRVIEGKPLFLNEHLNRLKNIAIDANTEVLKESIKILIKSIDINISQNIFLSYDPVNGANIVFFTKSFYPPEKWFDVGVDIGLLEIKRDNPNLKIYNDEYKSKVDSYLKDNNYFETLIAHDNIVTEGSRSNVFFIKENTIITTPIVDVLPGITRDKVIYVLNKLGMEILEKEILISELQSYDGCFITGTSIDVLPVRKLQEISYETGRNEVYKKVYKEFEKVKEADLNDYA